MGCFARTCGLTRTGILEGDKVFLIELNDNELMRYHSFLHKNDRVKQRNKELSEYGDGFLRVMEAQGNDLFKMKETPIRDAYIGTYDDYGGIEEEELHELDTNNIEHFIFHYWAVKVVMGEVETDMEFVHKFLKKLNFLRTSPIDTTLMGIQHPDIQECEEQLKLNLATNRFLRRRIKKLKEQ